jgi:pimeloyl-ACP methyl ester carboxylesterase
MSKALKKALRISGIVIIALLGILACGAIGNAAITRAERRANPAPGAMVEVDGGKMHVYTEGRGAHRVVLLTGFGSPSPVVDFGPLAKTLSRDYSVTIVEYLGYGWSDRTSRPRTSENIVQETRKALKKAGFAPPYLLMPHSMSGIYALRFCLDYPEEVEAVVALDTTLPEQGKYDNSSPMPAIYSFLRASGIVRVATLFNKSLMSYSKEHYSDEELGAIDRMASWNLYNRTILDESAAIGANCRELIGATYPRNIPVATVLASRTIEAAPRIFPGIDWKAGHAAQVECNVAGEIYVLEGSHNIYLGNAERIAEIVRKTIRD